MMKSSFFVAFALLLLTFTGALGARQLAGATAAVKLGPLPFTTAASTGGGKKKRQSARNATDEVFPSAAAGITVDAYQIMASGSMYTSSTNFFENNPRFSFLTNFKLPGYIFLAPTLDRFAASRNGVNPFDVGITVLGGRSDFEPYMRNTIGSLDFGTNSGMNGVISDLFKRFYSRNSYASNIDYTFTSLSKDGTYTFTMDTSKGISWGIAVTDQHNIFMSSTGWGAIPKKIAAGFIQVKVVGQTISGKYELYGCTLNTCIGLAAAAANFQGTRVSRVT